MHVAINALCINNRSGTGRYAYGLIDGLMRIDVGCARFSVLVPSEFTIPKSWRLRSAIQFCSISVSGALRRIYFEQFQLPSWLNVFQPDILHSPAFVAPIDAAKKIRQVVTIHDLAYMRYPETVPALKLAYYRWAIPRSVKCATHVVTDAETVAEQIKEQFDCSATISAIPLGVDTKRFAQNPDKEDAGILKHYGIDAPYVFFVGTQEPRKNLPMLVDAFQKAKHQGFTANLVLAGRYGWKQKNTLDAQSGVQRIGYVNDHHLPALYRNALIFAAPSLDEGFNLPTVEALSCGAPVIASDIPVHREILGEYAIYADPDNAKQWTDAFIQLEQTNLSSSGLRTHPTIKRRQPSLVREWTDVAKDTLKIYTDVLRA